ncbi:hypothetical protein M7I_0244 [Glarea lozoyensis 74030]|uniref:Uncharacterized protein n=1 Tax=Glarea lozoyensis (strain ATCC 74030 / MF5533) TaxID=1104152 RepID=H0ECU9_GLAL7|nr:hypothetical protein M7I_0244 [Glarea lozoyensis 74030]
MAQPVYIPAYNYVSPHYPYGVHPASALGTHPQAIVMPYPATYPTTLDRRPRNTCGCRKPDLDCGDPTGSENEIMDGERPKEAEWKTRSLEQGNGWRLGGKEWPAANTQL